MTQELRKKLTRGSSIPDEEVKVDTYGRAKKPPIKEEKKTKISKVPYSRRKTVMPEKNVQNSNLIKTQSRDEVKFTLR